MILVKSRLILVLASFLVVAGCNLLGSRGATNGGAKETSEEARGEANSQSSPADGEPAAVVVVLKGKKSSAVRAAIEQALGAQYQIVSSKRSRRASKRRNSWRTDST